LCFLWPIAVLAAAAASFRCRAVQRCFRPPAETGRPVIVAEFVFRDRVLFSNPRRPAACPPRFIDLKTRFGLACAWPLVLTSTPPVVHFFSLIGSLPMSEAQAHSGSEDENVASRNNYAIAV
jgi:hypothetical protein